MPDPLHNFHHLFIDHSASRTLFLLHGTGGDETDLLSLVEFAGKNYNILSLRGNVQEQGMNRFFKRIGPGVFDPENIREESTKLSEFLQTWYARHQLTANDAIFLGYSNGANMILATLFYSPSLITNGVLLHGMLPFDPPNLELPHHAFLVTYGENDQMIDPREGKKLVNRLQQAGARVAEVGHSGGHEIRNEELEAVKAFLAENKQ